MHEQPSHTQYQALGAYLSHLRDAAQAVGSGYHAPGSPPPAEALADVVTRFLDVFIDVWAHDRVAFEVLGRGAANQEDPLSDP